VNLQAKPPELSLSGADLTGLLRAVLAKAAPFRFQAKGSSMNPFIRDGDVVTVAPLRATGFCFGDIAAFADPETERLVIHRVIGSQGDLLLLKGDNAPVTDGLITMGQILGRVTRIERSGRRVRLGLGRERALIALLSRTRLLPVLLAPVRKLYRLLNPKLV
jgi:signal peptidase I